MRTDDNNPFYQPPNPPLGRLELAAVAAFPELIRLVMLRRSAPWSFRPMIKYDVAFLVGERIWAAGWNDAMMIRNVGDAKAYRCAADDGVVWERESTLIDVIDGLVDLPAPDAPGAPRLVRGRAERVWVPGMQLP